jgi:hypothetical protein
MVLAESELQTRSYMAEPWRLPVNGHSERKA